MGKGTADFGMIYRIKESSPMPGKAAAEFSAAAILGVALKPYLGELEVDALKFEGVYFFVVNWSIRDE